MALVPTRLMPGIREKRPGYYEVRLYGGVDPKTGKAISVSRTVRGTVKEANELRARLLLELDQYGPETQATVNELFEKVLAHLGAIGRERSTLNTYAQIMARAGARFGKLPVRKLRAEQLDRFYAELTAEGLTGASVHRYHAVIRRSLAQAVRWGWVAHNVADRATPPPERRPQIKLQTSEAVARLIEAAAQSRTPELAVAFRVLAALGGRRGELCGLRWSDIDPVTGACRIERSIKEVRGDVFVGDVKTHQGRTLLLDPGTLAVLATHRAAMASRAQMCSTTLVADAFVLSDSADGAQPWKPGRLTRALDRLRERSGYTGRLHDLRHWHASQLVGAGEDPALVAERLGHRDATTTMRWYAHALPEADRRAAGIIGGALDPPAEASFSGS